MIAWKQEKEKTGLAPDLQVGTGRGEAKRGLTKREGNSKFYSRVKTNKIKGFRRGEVEGFRWIMKEKLTSNENSDRSKSKIQGQMRKPSRSQGKVLMSNRENWGKHP